MQTLRCLLNSVRLSRLPTSSSPSPHPHSKHCHNISISDTSTILPPAPRKRRIRKSSASTATTPADISVAEDVRRHFCTPELEAIVRTFPAKFLRKQQRYPEHFYIADPLAARQIEALLLDGLDAERPLLEVNPGPGLLTQRLIDGGRVRDLRLYEAHRDFVPSLYSRFATTDAPAADAERTGAGEVRCSLRTGDMINLFRMGYQDRSDKGTRVQRFLADLPQRDWTDERPPFRMFACVGSVNFFKHLISMTVRQIELMSLGRVEFVLTMPPPMYIHLTCDGNAGLLLYRATSMLFQILFTHEFLARVPRKHFLPFQFNAPLKKYGRIASTLQFDRDYMYVVRVVPRRDLHDFVAAGQLQALWYFIKQNCISRKRCIIPHLEKLIPGAGARLILDQGGAAAAPVRILHDLQRAAVAEVLPPTSRPSTTMSAHDRYPNMSIYTTFGELTPSQILALFHQFISWPGYESSAFQQGMVEALQKIEVMSANCSIEEQLLEGVDEIKADDDVDESVVTAK